MTFSPAGRRCSRRRRGLHAIHWRGYLSRRRHFTGEPSTSVVRRLVSYWRTATMAESERAKQLRQYAERLAELRRYL